MPLQNDVETLLRQAHQLSQLQMTTDDKHVRLSAASLADTAVQAARDMYDGDIDASMSEARELIDHMDTFLNRGRSTQAGDHGMRLRRMALLRTRQLAESYEEAISGL